MDDPLRDATGQLLKMWVCPDCPPTRMHDRHRTRVHLHPDPDHPSQDATRDFIREHQYVHEQHLLRCAGDRSMMQLALRYPALHAGIIQVYGPIEDLTAEHRAQILQSAGFKDGDS